MKFLQVVKEVERAWLTAWTIFAESLGSRSFQYLVSVPSGADCWPLPLAGRRVGKNVLLMGILECLLVGIIFGYLNRTPPLIYNLSGYWKNGLIN